MEDTHNFYDLIIIGGGPAGLSAAIYAGRAKLKTLLINKSTLGGAAYTAREIVNYPGYAKVGGADLMRAFQQHAESFGVEFWNDAVVGADLTQDIKIVTTKKKKKFSAKAVIIAAGSEPRLLGIPGERELQGSGVAYCATCDAEFFKGEDVVVIGSGDQAIEESIYIAKFARRVTVIVLHDEGILDCNKISRDRALNLERIGFVWNSTVEEVLGEESVQGVRIRNIKTGKSTVHDCRGVFFFVGMVPSTRFLKENGLQMDHRGYIAVNELMETNLEGVYAIGDNRVKYLRQVVTAAADGATAAVAAERYIEEQDNFNTNILQGEKKVLLLFYNALDNDSLKFSELLEGVNRELSESYKIVRVDTATRKKLAHKYGIDKVPSVVLLVKGLEVKRLDCSTGKEKLRIQL